MRWPLILSGLALAGCGDSPADITPPPATAPAFRVLTWNLFLGTDFASLFDVQSMAEIPDAAAGAWADVQATDFPARAESIADALALTEPLLVGLQEVELFRMQSPGDSWFGEPATNVALDFVETLRAALTARDLDYTVASTTTTIDAEVPMTVASGTDDIRLTDREVILARPSVTVSNPRQGVFTAAARVSVPGAPITVALERGFTAVDAVVGGRAFVFVSAHLEAADDAVRDAQGREFLTALEDITGPLVLVGDFNASPASGLYADILAAGFTDAWSVAQGDGSTCCQAPTLANEASELGARIDYVFVRGGLSPTEALRVGDVATSRTPSGLWPSDHAGVTAAVQFP